MKVIIVPGNGNADPTKDCWYPYVRDALRAKGVEVIAELFPDPYLARESYWLPLLHELGADENTILIGHSSGAIAAMRYAEQHPILGSVLVSAYHSHLWNPMEMAAGYFWRPWNWEQIRNNQKFIIQFASTDDTFIPIREARFVHEELKTDYTEFTNRKHFLQSTFPEILEKLEQHLR